MLKFRKRLEILEDYPPPKPKGTRWLALITLPLFLMITLIACFSANASDTATVIVQPEEQMLGYQFALLAFAYFIMISALCYTMVTEDIDPEPHSQEEHGHD
jgi:hypothetical protein